MKLALVKLLWMFSAWLPLRVTQGLGALLGRVLAILPTRIRHVVRTNIKSCLPALTADEHAAFVRTCLRGIGVTWMEIGVFWHRPYARIAPLIRGVEGLERVDAAIASGRGVLLAMPHLGAWELLNLYCASRYPLTTLYREPRQESMDAWIRAARERTGARLVPASGYGVRQLFKALQRGEMVCVLPDQEPKRGSGVFAPFFGIQALTMTLFARLARRSGAMVVFGYAERLPAAQGYRLHFLPAPAGINDPDPAVAAAALNTGVEQAVRGQPFQYQWAYRRFRTRPEGEPALY